MSFNEAFEITIGHEGGYADHPADRGGKTMYGITEAVARKEGYVGDMRYLPLQKAKDIYRRLYWDTLKLDHIAARYPDLANEMFDSAVNCGTGTVGRWLQECLNILRPGTDISADGMVGPGTLKAFSEIRNTDLPLLLKLMNIMQGAHYIRLCARDPKQEAFIRGWMKRVVL